MTKKILKLIAGWLLCFGLTQVANAQNSVQLQVYYGGFGNECSWEIINLFDNSQVISGGTGASNSYSYNGNISIPAGEYVFIAYDSEGDGWTFTDGWYLVNPGSGISTGQTYFSDGYEQTTPFTVFSTVSNDLGVVSLLQPISSPGLSSAETVEMRIRNYGTSSQSNFSFAFSNDGGSTYLNETYSGTLLSGETLDFTFSSTANFSSTGSYNCKVVVYQSGDANTTNDTMDVVIESIPAISSFPWTETFSSWPPTDWQISGDNSWASYQSNAAFCNFFYWPDGNAELLTPPINLYSPGTLSFDWSSGFAATNLNDEFQVMISTDLGQSWQTLWDKTGAELNSNDGAGNTSPGTYISESIDLSSYAGNIIYIKFNGISGYGPNLYLDNVQLSLNPAFDLAVTTWIYPAEKSCSLTSNEHVNIRIKNVGSVSMSNFDVSYSVDGGLTYVTETVTSTLASGAELDYTFSASEDFSLFGLYDCVSSVNPSTDFNMTNNTLAFTIDNLQPINTFPFSEDFESGGSDFFALSANDFADASYENEGSNIALSFEGDATGSGWVGSSSSTSSTEAWIINTGHQAMATTCTVDATGLSTLELLLDLKQFYKYGPDYSWFRVLINGIQISDDNGISDFHPTTSYSDPYSTIRFDLSAYAGSQFELSFEASNKFSALSHPPGNVALIDNVILREIPPPDMAVVSLLSPVSACGLNSGEEVTVEFENLGGDAVSNIPVRYYIDGLNPVEEVISGPIPSGETYNYTFTQSADFSSTGTYQLQVVVDMNGDQFTNNDSLSFTVEHQVPAAAAISGLTSTICYYDSPITLSGLPAGGSFSGSGITGDAFEPQLAGSGIQDITYTYTDTLTNCVSSVTESIEVIGSEVSFNGLYSGPATIPVLVQVYYNSFWVSEQSWDIIDESGTVVLSGPSGTTQNGYSYNGTINLPLGNYTFVAYDQGGDGWLASWYNITPDVGTGTGQQYYMVPVSQQPMYSQSTAFTVGGSSNFCLYDTPVTLSGTPVGGVFSGSGISGSTFDPSVAGVGTHTITYTYTTNGCSGSGSQMVVVENAPALDLGSDLLACSGETVQLDAGSGAASYSWSTGESTQVISVTSTGNYSVTISNSSGCTSSDNIQVDFVVSPTVDLGVDIDACAGDLVNLDAGTATSYQWSSGETQQQISVSSDGTYSVTVSVGSCTASDQVQVVFHQPILDLGSDISACEGSDVTIDAGSAFSSYLWSTSETTSSVLTGFSGAYSCTVSDQYGCIASDGLNVTINQNPIVDLGQDTTIGNEYLLLDAGPGFVSYSWTDGSSNQGLLIDGTILSPATYPYSVTVTDANGCSGEDLIQVTIEVINVTQNILLPQGWSIFSSYIIPPDAALTTLFSGIVSDVSIVKDGNGNAYWPAFGYNGIGNMVIDEGYQVMMFNANTLSVIGTKVAPESTDVTIPAGWSIMAYLRDSEGDAALMVSSVVSNISIIKDGNGDVYWPGFLYNGIGNMKPGEGYQISAYSAFTFNYPANGPSAQNKASQSDGLIFDVENTGQNMTLAVPLTAISNLPSGLNYIMVFNQNNKLCGASEMKNDPCVITLWGNNELSSSEALSSKESYQLFVFNDKLQQFFKLTDVRFEKGDGKYSPDDIEILSKAKILYPDEFNSTIRCFPNPANDYTELDYSAVQEGDVQIRLLNLEGKVIKEIYDGLVKQGKNTFYLPLTTISQGFYMIEIKENNNNTISFKLLKI